MLSLEAFGAGIHKGIDFRGGTALNNTTFVLE